MAQGLLVCSLLQTWCPELSVISTMQPHVPAVLPWLIDIVDFFSVEKALAASTDPSKSALWPDSAVPFLNTGTPLLYVYLPLSLSPRKLTPISPQSRTSRHCLCKAKFMLSQQQNVEGKKTRMNLGSKLLSLFQIQV